MINYILRKYENNDNSASWYLPVGYFQVGDSVLQPDDEELVYKNALSEAWFQAATTLNQFTPDSVRLKLFIEGYEGEESYLIAEFFYHKLGVVSNKIVRYGSDEWNTAYIECLKETGPWTDS